MGERLGEMNLEEMQVYLRERIAPLAEEADRDPEVLRLAISELGEANLLALNRPAEYGGPAAEEAKYRGFQEAMAQVSGVTAFLQTQHQSAVSMLAKSSNADLKSRTLPFMANGERLIGIGFSQLRRSGPPMLTADQVEGGYRLTGRVPWVTGYSFFHDFVVGASLPSGEAVFAIVPFVNTERDGGKLAFTPPMQLASMETAQTVAGDFTNFYVPSEDVLFVRPDGWIQGNDMINITLQGYFAIGCALAGIDIVAAAHRRRPEEFLGRAVSALSTEVEECREALHRLSDSEEDRLRSRSWAIDLAVRCAHAGVAASSGAANSIHHPAQRVYREALVFTVSAQTGAIMEATLDRLIKRGGYR